MLYGNVFVSHSFCLILCAYQYTVQILTDVNLASGNFRTFFQSLYQAGFEFVLINLHLFYQF